MVYMGSKARIAYDIIPIILSKRHPLYCEPFVGGCNMIDKIKGIPRMAGDVNFYLISMWQALQKGWIPPKYVSKEEYLNVKEYKIAFDPELVGWIGFNCSFSGKWFGGYAGETETQQGIRNYQDEAWRGMMLQSKDLKDVAFFNRSYYDLPLLRGSLVYCDPPYADTTGYSHDFDHKMFWDWAEQKSKDCTLFVSEYTAPEDWICVWKAKLGSTLSGKNKESIESLFIHSSKNFKIPNDLFSNLTLSQWNALKSQDSHLLQPIPPSF